MEGKDYIDWDELVFRAKWVLKEYPDQCSDVKSMMQTLFEKYLIPEIALGIRRGYHTCHEGSGSGAGCKCLTKMSMNT
jgi:hypothetical protein